MLIKSQEVFFDVRMDFQNIVCLVEVKRNGREPVGYAVCLDHEAFTDALFGKQKHTLVMCCQNQHCCAEQASSSSNLQWVWGNPELDGH